jgi:hypothetical protein
LEQLVQIDSGTGDVAGLATMGAILKIELEQLGANVESVSAMAAGRWRQCRRDTDRHG